MLSTAAQLALLVITPMVTGSISFTASLTLIIMIRRSNIKLGTVYRRLVFGMSVFDLIQSFSQGISSIPMPAGSFLGAAGNNITCSMQGFLTVIGVNGSVLYSLSLSVYFIAVIKFNMSERRIKSHLEPFLHIVPILYSLAGGVFLSATGSLNPSGAICWIGPDLSSCNDDEECIKRLRNINTLLTLVFSGGLVVFVFTLNCVALSVIYWTEYSQSLRNQFYQTSWMQNQQQMNRSSFSPFNANNNENHTSPLATRLTRPSRASLQRRREISNRAIAFIIGFLLTYIPPFLFRGWEILDPNGAPFALKLLSRFFLPLQGLLNIIIYTYPHVVSRYNANEDYSWIRAFWEVVKSGGDKDQQTGRRLTADRIRRLRGNVPLRRNSIRNEPVVTDINEILTLAEESTTICKQPEENDKGEATTGSIEQV